MYSEAYALRSAISDFTSIIGDAAGALGIEIDAHDIEPTITFPKAEYGDLSSSIPLRLSKELRQSPKDIAERIAGAAKPSGMVRSIVNADGYLNAWLDEARYAEAVLTTVLRERESYGSSSIGNGSRVIVEYPSVNPNKPWHIGHLRNALLGDSISNILSLCSYAVEREDYIDDLGLQMAEILWGVRKIGVDKGKKYDQALGELYVKVNSELERQGKALEEEIGSLLRRMETHGSEEANEAREISEKSVAAQYETAFSYGIYHDVLVWESDIVREKLAEAALDYLKQRGLISFPDNGKYNGCTVLCLERLNSASKDNGDESKVLVRSSGALTYMAKDIAFHMWKLGILGIGLRYKKFLLQPDGREVYSSSSVGESMEFGSASKAINVIGSGQRYPQDILAKVIALISNGTGEVKHLSYGEVEVKGGTLSGRSGGWMGSLRNYTADDLLREVSAKVGEIVRSGKRPEGVDAEAINIVALSAIKFEFLRLDPEKKVLFEWERALDFNANSGPYCMYMYARASRIMEKAGSGYPELSSAVFSMMKRNEGFALLKLIGMLPYIIEKACRELRPNVIADYLLDLSSEFASFYEHVPVLKSAAGLRELRLGMILAVRQTIYNSLRALGISAVEVM